VSVVDAFVSDGKATGAGDDDKESEGFTLRIDFV